MGCVELIPYVLSIFVTTAQRKVPVLSQDFLVAPASVQMKCMRALLARRELLVEASYVIRVGQKALACVSCAGRIPLKTNADFIVVAKLAFPSIFP